MKKIAEIGVIGRARAVGRAARGLPGHANVIYGIFGAKFQLAATLHMPPP